MHSVGGRAAGCRHSDRTGNVNSLVPYIHWRWSATIARIAPGPPPLDLEQLTFPKLFGVDVIGVIAVPIRVIVVPAVPLPLQYLRRSPSNPPDPPYPGTMPLDAR